MNDPVDEIPFPFMGDALAFDFINTEILWRRKPIDLLPDENALVLWWQTAATHYNLPAAPTVTPELFETAKALRTNIRRIFYGLVLEQTIDNQALTYLNTTLRQVYIQVAINTHEFHLHYDTVASNSKPLLPILESVLWLLTNAEKDRLRKCKNDQCMAYFYDTTKNENRVWCCTDCMNRARSALHYEQRKYKES
jgi:predicted RNA-binding Zn ribbon-like protein